ncbi:Uncharacterised protein [Mycobacteroides abscessus subsp. abscessus]|nr:Uncharacterised protein [Mycobacteroides abscessus subsp. abscessus]
MRYSSHNHFSGGSEPSLVRKLYIHLFLVSGLSSASGNSINKRMMV